MGATSVAGAPNKYTEEIGDYICEELCNGRSLLSISKEDITPDKATIYRWLLSKDPELDEFRDKYAVAREIQYQAMSDEIMDIADDGVNDYVLNNSEDGDLCRVNPEAIGRSRLRVDTRKWYMSKVLPKFKDKQEENNATDDLAAALLAVITKQPD